MADNVKHTPGPWDVDDGDFSVYQLETVQPITGSMEYMPNGQANARLIAAAPDLLAALQQAITLMPLGTNKRAEWIDKATAAIAKATGEV